MIGKFSMHIIRAQLSRKIVLTRLGEKKKNTSILSRASRVKLQMMMVEFSMYISLPCSLQILLQFPLGSFMAGLARS